MVSGAGISIIVPHYDDLVALDRCLRSLADQQPPEGFDTAEIVVADNASPCGLDAVRKVAAGRARVVLAEIPGAGPARNRGVQEARGAILAFTDCDCVPAPGWLRAGVGALANSDIVGGAIEVLTRTDRRMTGAEAFERVFAFDNRDYVLRHGFTVTANLFCSAETFSGVGPFRADVSEDKEWCLRAREKGFSIGFAPGAMVGHPARPDWPSLLRKWRRINRESYALACNGGGGRLSWIARTWMLPASIAVHGWRIVRTPVLPDGRTRLRALSTLVALRLWRFWDQHRLMLR